MKLWDRNKMRAKEFLESDVVDLQQWKKKKGLHVFDVSYDDLYKDFIHLWNTGDEWADTMGTLFAVADELYRRGDGPPDHWKYKPGAAASADDFDDGILGYMNLKRAGSPPLEKFGEFLLRLVEKLKAEGKDY